MLYGLIKGIKDEPSFIWWIKSIFYLLGSERKHVTIKKLLEMNKRYNEESIKGIVFMLEDLGCLAKIENSKDLTLEKYEIIFDKFEKIFYQVIGVLEYLEELEGKDENYYYQIIGTIPDSQTLKYRELRRRVRTISDTVYDIISKASNEIIILNPFLMKKGSTLL